MIWRGQLLQLECIRFVCVTGKAVRAIVTRRAKSKRWGAIFGENRKQTICTELRIILTNVCVNKINRKVLPPETLFHYTYVPRMVNFIRTYIECISNSDNNPIN